MYFTQLDDFVCELIILAILLLHVLSDFRLEPSNVILACG
jgi:hypothetical protein